jgi:hypothetical protein
MVAGLVVLPDHSMDRPGSSPEGEAKAVWDQVDDSKRMSEPNPGSANEELHRLTLGFRVNFGLGRIAARNTESCWMHWARMT